MIGEPPAHPLDLSETIVAQATVSGRGALAIVEKGRMEDQCKNVSGSTQCSEAGVESAHSGDTYATVANVLVPIGIVGLGVGGYWLWSSSRPDERASLRAAPLGTHGAAVQFASTF